MKRPGLLAKVTAGAQKLRERIHIHILVEGFEERFHRKATAAEKELIAESFTEMRRRHA